MAKKQFRLIAPTGMHTAYREILSPSGKRVLAIETGAYLQRLGNLRESVVYTLDENGKDGECIICEFGGVIRQLIKYLNNEPNELAILFTLSSEAWKRLDQIKDKEK